MQAVIGRPKTESGLDTDTYLSKLEERLQSVHETARVCLKKSAVYRKSHYDLGAKSRLLEEGQAVWVHDSSRKPGVCPKLVSRWKGLYLVTKRIYDITY